MQKTKNKIAAFFIKKPKLKTLFQKLSLKERTILEKIILLNEGERVFAFFDRKPEALKNLKKMAKAFLETESFYRGLGGLEGYFKCFLKLLKETKPKTKGKPKTKLLEPKIIDITKRTPSINKYIEAGLKNLPLIAEVYPLGGSGDRLKLTSNKGKPLPAAQLPFLGRSLLEGLIRDLQAREYLYYKTYKKKVLVPIALMTSDAKDNHAQILKLLEENNYFQRPKSSFFIFKQISVPVISEEGHFVLKNPHELLLKPGGHGVIWKLMEEKGAFKWLLKQKRAKLLIRQINNPVAGLDYGLLAFTGYGIKEKKAFGFAACPRRVKSAEGSCVLKLKTVSSSFHYNISNVEYTDFTKWGIVDKPREKGSLYSKYPANTNILFADIKELMKAVKKDPYPGIIINLKTKATDLISKKQVRSGRLELMMQNIADVLDSKLKKTITEKGKLKLKTYLSYGERIGTLSSAKKAYEKGASILETPEGAFFDYLKNMQVLFKTLGFTLPSFGSEKEYIAKGPAFSIILHPALGPLFSEIAKKISVGKIRPGSELILDLAEVSIQKLTLDGSLIVEGQDLKSSFLALKNVTIQNGGIDRKKPNCFWKNEVVRKGQFYLKLNQNSQFFAEDICFKGSFKLEVFKNEKVTAYLKKGKVVFKREKLKKR